MAVHTPCPSVVSAPATVVYAITWLFSVACAAHTYWASGLVAVSPKPPVVPVLGGPGVGVAATGVGDGVGIGVDDGADKGVALEVGAGVVDPHPASAMP